MTNLDNRIANADQLLTQDVEKLSNSIGELYSNLSKVKRFVCAFLFSIWNLRLNIISVFCASSFCIWWMIHQETCFWFWFFIMQLGFQLVTIKYIASFYLHLECLSNFYSQSWISSSIQVDWLGRLELRWGLLLYISELSVSLVYMYVCIKPLNIMWFKNLAKALHA